MAIPSEEVLVLQEMDVTEFLLKKNFSYKSGKLLVMIELVVNCWRSIEVSTIDG